MMRRKERATVGDPFLNYFALFLLVFVVVVLFYGIIAIHDIPAKIAESRDHPHQDAIHAAGWVSLFTLHALWPFLWIWAMAYRPERGWGMSHQITPAGRGARKDDRSPIMELLLILIYVSICYVTFKVFRIPVNQWSLATAALGGIIGIVLLLLIINYNHHFTTNARIYFAVTPVFPSVRGRVIEVPVQANVPLKEGEVLFRVDPKPYQYVVDQKKALLAEAEQNVRQLKASLDQATAGTEKV